MYALCITPSQAACCHYCQSWARSFLEKQFSSAAGGLHDRFDERHAELAFFELHDSVNGASRGRGYGVLQQGGVIAGFQNHTRRAFHGLRRKQSCYIAWETHLDTGFGERFEDDVGKRRAAGGKPGHGVHVFFVYGHGATDRVEHRARRLQVLRPCMRAAAKTSVFSLSSGAISFNTSPTTCGFTPRSTMSAPFTALRLSVVTDTPSSLASAAAFSACFTVAVTRFGEKSSCFR